MALTDWQMRSRQYLRHWDAIATDPTHEHHRLFHREQWRIARAICGAAVAGYRADQFADEDPVEPNWLKMSRSFPGFMGAFKNRATAWVRENGVPVVDEELEASVCCPPLKDDDGHDQDADREAQEQHQEQPREIPQRLRNCDVNLDAGQPAQALGSVEATAAAQDTIMAEEISSQIPPLFSASLTQPYPPPVAAPSALGTTTADYPPSSISSGRPVLTGKSTRALELVERLTRSVGAMMLNLPEPVERTVQPSPPARPASPVTPQRRSAWVTPHEDDVCGTDEFGSPHDGASIRPGRDLDAQNIRHDAASVSHNVPNFDLDIESDVGASSEQQEPTSEQRNARYPERIRQWHEWVRNSNGRVNGWLVSKLPPGADPWTMPKPPAPARRREE